MIYYVTGTLSMVEENFVVVENNGMGIRIFMPPARIPELPETGQEVILYTYTYVREDSFQLYGFAEKEELEIFQKVITVSGIGPKGGLAMLSTYTAKEILQAIVTEDDKTIAKTPGIGPKTAKKMILELKDKIDIQADILAPTGDNAEVNDAILGLESLGYKRSEAAEAVRKVAKEGMNAEEILKRSLLNLSR